VVSEEDEACSITHAIPEEHLQGGYSRENSERIQEDFSDLEGQVFVSSCRDSLYVEESDPHI